MATFSHRRSCLGREPALIQTFFGEGGFFPFLFSDISNTGFIHEDHLRELLTTMGDRFTDEEVDEMYREAPIDKKGNFNYVEFTRILKHGAKDKDDEN